MSSAKSNPIGVLDSGVGGLTVWRELIEMLPNENTIYFADSINCPYGSKTIDEIRKLTINIVEFLLSQNCKLILIACNSISSSIINELRRTHPSVPFVGIEPAIKVAASETATKNIGVLATEATINGELYNNTKKNIPDDIEIHLQIGYNLVDIVERGESDTDEAREILRKYITPFLESEVDRVVLGCTHYPFLIDEMKKISGDKIDYLNPAKAVVKQVERLLDKFNLMNEEGKRAGHILYSSGNIFPVRKLLPELDYSRIQITTNYVLQ